MNRRIISTLLAGLLLLGCLPALAAEYNAGNIYTITYDEAAWQLDNTAYREECTQEYLWLFMLYNRAEDILIDAAIEVVPEFDGLTLRDADASQRINYLAATLDGFADQSFSHLDTLMAGELQIPFYVYALEDEQGQALYAETIVSGCSISFYASHPLTGLLTDTLLTALEDFLLTFTPVLPGSER